MATKQSREKIKKAMGLRLAELRERRQLNQAELAKRTGLQPSMISHAEGGVRLPSVPALFSIADELNVTLDYLLGRSDQQAETKGGPQVRMLVEIACDLTYDDLDRLVAIARALRSRGRES
jgi:transcriptional regulator with XRE-family HTH domain